MATDWAAAVFAHGDFIPLAENLWWIKSSQKGMPLPRNMTVYRLPSGDLVLHSVICLDAARMEALEKLGTPRYMIVPNEGHRTDAPRYKARYPKMQVLSPSGSKTKIEEIIPVEATCEDVLPGLGIVCHVPDGTKPPSHELVYEVDVPGGKAGWPSVRGRRSPSAMGIRSPRTARASSRRQRRGCRRRAGSYRRLNT